MAALGFKFPNTSRAVDYFVDLVRQERPQHSNGRRIAGLCAASAELCVELATRAVEAGGYPDAAILDRGAAKEADDEGAPTPTVPARSELWNWRLARRRPARILALRF